MPARELSETILKPYPDMAVVAYCHTGMVTQPFAHSLALLASSDPFIEALIATCGAMLPMNRNKFTHDFLNNYKAPWLWIVDSDMTFPRDTLRQLIAVAHATDVEIVCGNYVNGLGFSNLCDLECIQVKDLKTNTSYEIGYGGTGCMLVSRALLMRIHEQYESETPHEFFGYGYRHDNQGKLELIGEDYLFCMRARTAGAKIVCWTGLELGHIKFTELKVLKND